MKQLYSSTRIVLLFVFLLLFLTLLQSLQTFAQTRQTIRIVGSSTVYPFSTVVAENFGRESPYPTPIVESTGTGGGFKLFCSGIGLTYPDINNASRPMKPSEYALCAQNGIPKESIQEVAIGFDGIVLANSHHAPRFNLSTKHIFLALAAHIPIRQTSSDQVATKPISKLEHHRPESSGSPYTDLWTSYYFWNTRCVFGACHGKRMPALS